MRRDRVAFVVAVEAAVRADGTMGTKFTVRCPYCRGTHWLWRLPRHIPAPCVAHAGYFIEPVLALRSRSDPEQRSSAVDEYIERCRTAGRDTGLDPAADHDTGSTDPAVVGSDQR